MALVALAEVGARILRPLVGLGQQHAVSVTFVQFGAEALQDFVGLGQVLVVGTLALDQIRHGVEPQAIHADVEPEAQDA